MADIIAKNLTREQDIPTVAEFKQLGSIVSSDSITEDIIKDYMFNSVNLIDDLISGTLTDIGGYDGVLTHLGEISQGRLKRAIIEVAGRALNFYESSLEYSMTDQDGSNESTAKSFAAKIFTNQREMVTPNLMTLLNKTGIYQFIKNGVMPFSTKENYLNKDEIVQYLNQKINGLDGAIDLDPLYFKVVDGKIQIITSNLPDNLKFADGTEVSTQATKAEDIVSVEDIAIREIAEANATSIESINEEQTIQNGNIATNTGNIEAIIATLEEQTIGQFKGETTGGPVSEGVWTPIVVSQTKNTFANITYSSGLFTLTEDINDLSFTLFGQAQNTGVSKNVSIRLLNEDTSQVVGNIQTETIDNQGKVWFTKEANLVAGNYKFYITATTGGGTITFTQGEIIISKFGGANGLATSGSTADTSASEPTSGINPKLIKVGENTTSINELETTKADKTYVDTELEKKVDKVVNYTSNDVDIEHFLKMSGSSTDGFRLTAANGTGVEIVFQFSPSKLRNVMRLRYTNDNWATTQPEPYTPNDIDAAEIINKRMGETLFAPISAIRKLAMKLGLQEQDILEIMGGEENE